MSRKTGQYKENMEESNAEMRYTTEDVSRGTKDTLDQVVETLNANKLLIGAIAAACGVAYYLFATESGKRLRYDIQDKALDLYDVVSEEAANTVERLRGITQSILSEQHVGPVSRNIRRVA